jgi:hypothetical protein
MHGREFFLYHAVSPIVISFLDERLSFRYDLSPILFVLSEFSFKCKRISFQNFTTYNDKPTWWIYSVLARSERHVTAMTEPILQRICAESAHTRYTVLHPKFSIDQ